MVNGSPYIYLDDKENRINYSLSTGINKLFNTLISIQLHIHMVTHEEETGGDGEECPPRSGSERELQHPD